MTGASAARLAAARALVEVDGGAHLEDALDGVAPRSGSDRDLAWFLAYGVLRRRGHVDAAIRRVLTQPLAALDPPVRAALRVGAFELLFARTRRHAAVHQAVESVRELGCGRAHGLVNAVLRRLEPPTELGGADALDHPAWLVARWRSRYGEEAAARWCRDNAEPPPLFVVAQPGVAPEPDWAPVEVRGERVPDVYRAASGGPIPDRPGFREGRWWVQDLASVRVADLLGPLAPGPGGEPPTVLDACSAPGGKAYRLASRGARVVAADLDPVRLERLAEGAVRLGLSDRIAPRVVDWTSATPAVGEAFDAVLVDAPCTGLGTVRRHPEIRWRRTEADLARSAATQHRILTAAADRVRPGGVLVYGVCSPEPEEGDEVVARLVQADPRWKVEATLSTAPPEQGEDAHFGARLRRSV